MLDELHQQIGAPVVQQSRCALTCRTRYSKLAICWLVFLARSGRTLAWLTVRFIRFSNLRWVCLK